MEDVSCVNPNGVSISPRIVPIALFDTATYVAEAAACSGTGCVAKISNIVGFFVEGMCDEVYNSPPPYCGSHPDKAVVGRFVDYPGTYLSTGGTTTSKVPLSVRLVRENVKRLPDVEAAVILRVDFTNDLAWHDVCAHARRGGMFS